MESPKESSTDASYRIPADVFTPDTPSKVAEWSAASHESLFSIQIGRSFTREEFLWRTEELGSPGPGVAYMPSPANNPVPTQSAHNEVATDGKCDEVGKPETTVDSWKGVIRESEDQNNQKSHVVAHISHHSMDSMTSEKSFAFPILIGHADKDGPDSIRGSSSQKQQQQQPKSETPPNQENEPLKSPESESENQQGEAQPAQTSWFSYFSCCTRTSFS